MLEPDLTPYTSALVFANGDLNDGPMVREALSRAGDSLIVAADGGARIAAHYALTPHLIIGDMDSLQEDELQMFAADGATIQRYDPEKDETDLELVLCYLANHDAIAQLIVIGGLGDRLDQTLANLYLLALPELSNLDVRMVAGKQEVRLLRPGTHTIHGQDGDTISLLPLGGNVHGVSTERLHYALDNETLYFGPARGVSNVMTDSTAQIRLRDGLLLLTHTIGRA